MLRFFRINDPYRLVFIFLMIVLVRLVQNYFIDATAYYELKWLLLGEWLNQGFHMYSEAFDYTGPIAAFVYKYLNWIFGRTSFIHYGVSSLLIVFQAGIFNQLMLKNKAYDENGYLPAFLYAILMVCIPDFMTLSPQLLSLTFVLLALRNVLRRIDNQVTDELFLNTGLFLGIATMIYLPAIIFFVVFLFALILFSTAITRRLLLYLFSFCLAFVLCALYFYWRGDFNVFIQSYIIQNLILKAGSPVKLSEFLIIGTPFLLIFLLSVMKTWSSARLTNFQNKIQQVIWLMFFGGAITFLLSNEKSLHEFVFMVPVIAYFWTHYFILLKRKIFQFLMPGFLILGMICYTCFTYQDFVKPLIIVPSQSEEELMVLGSDLSYYHDQKIATPCFNEQLSEQAFEGLSYYQSAAEIYQLFQKADPEIVIDQMDIMPEIQYRFPDIEKKYEKKGNKKYAKISN